MFNIQIITPTSSWLAFVMPVDFATAMAFVRGYVKSHGSYAYEVLSYD